MNKYVFPGADASCALNWVIGQVEGVGFEVKSVDVLGVHCEFCCLSLFDRIVTDLYLFDRLRYSLEMVRELEVKRI